MSVSLTIPDLDDDTYRRLEAEAQRRGADVESIAKKAIEKGLGGDHAATLTGPPYHDLDFLAGTWSEEEAREFEKNTSEFRRIDPEMWQ
jgi:hypothetical protein